MERKDHDSDREIAGKVVKAAIDFSISDETFAKLLDQLYETDNIRLHIIDVSQQLHAFEDKLINKKDQINYRIVQILKVLSGFKFGAKTILRRGQIMRKLVEIAKFSNDSLMQMLIVVTLNGLIMRYSHSQKQMKRIHKFGVIPAFFDVMKKISPENLTADTAAVLRYMFSALGCSANEICPGILDDLIEMLAQNLSEMVDVLPVKMNESPYAIGIIERFLMFCSAVLGCPQYFQKFGDIFVSSQELPGRLLCWYVETSDTFLRKHIKTVLGTLDGRVCSDELLFNKASQKLISRALRQCDATGCSKTDGLKCCSKCYAVFYCSTKCQKRCWKTHKKACKGITK